MDWQSQHASGLPIVNSAIVSFIDSELPEKSDNLYNSSISDFLSTNQDLYFPAGTIFPRGFVFSDDFLLTNGTIPTENTHRLRRNFTVPSDITTSTQYALDADYDLVDQFHITTNASTPYLFPGAAPQIDLFADKSVYRIPQYFEEEDPTYDSTPNDLSDNGIDLGESLIAQNTQSPLWAADCFPVALPAFQLRVQELWPDNAPDRTKILELFGADSLDWWNALSNADKKRRTEGRGLEWWDNLSNNQREQRVEDLTEIVSCSEAPSSWCRWLPQGRGYFEVALESAWLIESFNRRGWVIPNTRDALDAALDATNTDPISLLATRQSVQNTYERIAGIMEALPVDAERLLPHAPDIQAWLVANVPTQFVGFGGHLNSNPIYSRYARVGIGDNFRWDLDEAERFIAGFESGGVKVPGLLSIRLNDIKFHLNASGLPLRLQTSYTDVDEQAFATRYGLTGQLSGGTWLEDTLTGQITVSNVWGDGLWDGGFGQDTRFVTDETKVWLQRQVAEWMGLELDANGTPIGVQPFPPGISSRASDADDIEFLYETSEQRYWCPTLDVRVECGVKQVYGAFVPSGERVGILVNELRVSSRTPTLD